MELIWKNFTEAPMLSCFKTLKNHAHRAECWPEWKVKALAHLRETLTRQRTAAKSAASRWDRPGDSSALVEILLYEKDDDGAWREARSGGCAPYLWLALAEARRDKHPEDALAVYQEDVAAALAHTGEAVYEHSISMLLKIKALLERLGRADEFGGYVGGLREQHRRKRNLLKRLDARGW
jgi:uncharacterized Zn finger protein